MSRIGVFVCHCGMNIASTVDVDELTRYAGELEEVVVSKNYTYFCSDPGAKLIKDCIKEFGLNGVVIASCSPRMHEQTFRRVVEEAGMNPYLMEMANIREQCSWVHDDREKATDKAKATVRGAVAKARLLEPLEKSKIEVIPHAMVIGGGIAGIQASLDLAEEGFKVYLVEKEPSIGGRMAQLDKTFPTLDCSSCILTPKMMDVGNHQNIELLTYSEVIGIEGSVGNFRVRIRKKPRYVDEEKCTGCGECAEACRLNNRIPSEFDMKLGKRSAIYLPFLQAVPLKYTIDPEHCLYLTRGKCGTSPACKEACIQNAIDFDQKEKKMEINVGAIVVATGYDLLNPEEMYEYGYSSKDVITTLELERMFDASGPMNGKIYHPSDKKVPNSVTFILCVGSRDEELSTHCCRIGCMTALKHAYLLKEKLGEVDINICFTDIRAFGKGYEEFYRKLRGMGINFFHGRPSEVYPMGDHLKMDVFDIQTDKLLEIKTDMVVLVPALLPRMDADDLARLLHISQSQDGFFMEAHPKLRPVDTHVDGIFIAGCCQSPKDIQDTVAQASGAAARAATILSKPELEVEPLIATVDTQLCSGCDICKSVCDYSAIELVEEEIDGITKVHSEINDALCKGCGSCVTACSSSAIQQKGFKDEQINTVIDAFVE